MIKKKVGKIIEDPRANIRDHERRTARALANAGFTVEFIAPANLDFTKSPDVLIDGEIFEMKSPQTQKWNQLQNNLKKANRQAKNIIIDSQRIKRLPDKVVQKFLEKRFIEQGKSIKKLWFITRSREVVKIGEEK